MRVIRAVYMNPAHIVVGRGIVKSPRSISIEIQRKLSSIVRRARIDAGNSDLTLKIFLHIHLFYEGYEDPMLNFLEKIEKLRC